MGSSQEFVDFVLQQFDEDCGVTARKMFGEYGLYSQDKMFALVCDDRLFIKPTEGGLALVGEPQEASPYPGAKPAWVIEERLEDREWLSELARVTAQELPAPLALGALRRRRHGDHRLPEGALRAGPR